jgi:hypothetical protein
MAQSQYCFNDPDPCARFEWPGYTFCIDRYELSFISGTIPSTFAPLDKLNVPALRAAWSDKAVSCAHREASYGVFSNASFLKLDLTGQVNLVLETISQIETLSTTPNRRERYKNLKNEALTSTLPLYKDSLGSSLFELKETEATLSSLKIQAQAIIDKKGSELLKEQSYKQFCRGDANNKISEISTQCLESGLSCELSLTYSFLGNCSYTATSASLINEVSKLIDDINKSLEKVATKVAALDQTYTKVVEATSSMGSPVPATSSCESLTLAGLPSPLKFPKTSPGQSIYGISAKLFTGDWTFEELGVTTQVQKGRYHVMNVAEHARRCYLDPLVGRMSLELVRRIRANATGQDADSEVLEALINASRELKIARKSINSFPLGRYGLTSENDVRFLKSSIDLAQISLNSFALTEQVVGSLLYFMKIYDGSINSYLNFMGTVRGQLTQSLEDGNTVDYLTLISVIDSNSSQIYTQFENLFGSKARSELETSIVQLIEIPSTDLELNISTSLENIFGAIESSVNSTFERGTKFDLLTAKLVALFGCPNTDLKSPLDQLFKSKSGIKLLQGYCEV